LDFSIVVVSVVVLALDALLPSVQWLKGLRVLRALKPLRTLTRSPGMMLVFRSVTLSLASMANVSIVVGLFFLIFAIMGVQLFGGRFWTCNDISVANKAACTGYFDDSGVLTERVWTNPYQNYDNVGKAILSLFIAVTLNGYSPAMYAAMAAPSNKDDQPKATSNGIIGFLFYAAFIVICAFCLLNLYVGVIFSEFSKIRLLSTAGSAFLTTKQQEWTALAKMVFRLKPLQRNNPPTNRIRLSCYRAVHTKTFNYVITTVIVVNIIILASTVYNESTAFTNAKEACNYGFTAIFIVEAAIKITGLGWRSYWRNGWNKFDFFLILMAIVDIGFTVIAAHGSQKLLRLLRIARIIKLIKGFKGLKALLTTLIISLPAFYNVGALLMLVFFMYSYVAVLLFGTIQPQAAITNHANFSNFGRAALTMFRVSTGDDWVYIMQQCGVRPPNGCGNPILSALFFCSFTVIITMILLNLFTAVVLENFEIQEEQAEWTLTPAALEEFQELWAEYDDGSGTIAPEQLQTLLIRTDPPLGLGRMATGRDVLRFVFNLDIPLVNGRVPFHRTVYELVRNVSETQIPE
ncbi:MAG: voltage-gated ion channel superfamily, partial [Trebouxia sp. A1-2]